jgi:hypothetical protein
MKGMNSESCSTVLIPELLGVAGSADCLWRSVSVAKRRRNRQEKDSEFAK